ncbi:MAG: methylenetetrahydrofolate reductase [Alphaproteobacteria bacterium]|nr:methylenetetrahydrofolate reductase [Alphaproteobacteria bacterium]
MAILAEAMVDLEQNDTGDLDLALRALFRDFTIETTPTQAERLGDFRQWLPTGTTVNVTHLPRSDLADTIKTCGLLRSQGFNPVPHVAARSIAGRHALEDMLARCSGECGVDEVLVIAGGIDKPVGPYENSMQILETGLFDRFGIRRIGVAGHPEGSPDIPDHGIIEALKWKVGFSERTGAELYIVTQFLFESAPLFDWERRLRAAGFDIPVRVGFPGPATLRGLIGYARACGIGPSMRALLRRASLLKGLSKIETPSRLAIDIAGHVRSHSACLIERAHIYPLGGIGRAANWSQAVREGRFTLAADRMSFDVFEAGRGEAHTR